MQSQEFIQPYRRSIPDHGLHVGEYREALYEGREWARNYGQALYDNLSGVDVNPEQYEGNYLSWVYDSLPTAVEGLGGFDTPQQQRALRELSFHDINAAMYPMWFPVINNGNWQSYLGDRASAINLSQNKLALGGLHYYLSRENIAGKQAGYAYFDKDNEAVRHHIEGIANEYDAGVVLMEAIKPYPDLTVVPGPPQFEHDMDRSHVAADYVVVSTEGKAVGVQVKSSVSKDQLDHYDPSRIMLIDASADFGNSRVLRTKQESSQLKRVGWAGVICAQRVSGIKTHGRTSHADYLGDSLHILCMQMRAREIASKMKSQLPSATAIVRDRMTRLLHATPERTNKTIVDLSAKEKVS